MSWQIVVLIAIGAAVLLFLASGVLGYLAWSKMNKQVQNIFGDMNDVFGEELWKIDRTNPLSVLKKK